MKFVAGSDTGKRRTNNEDSLFAKIYNEDISLFIVADGLGGYSSGEVASKIVVDTISGFIEDNLNFLSATNEKQIMQKIKESVLEANNKIYNLEKTDKKYDNMGSTVVLVLKVNKKLFYASIGDTRLYFIDKNFESIKQITIDDTYVNELVKTNVITEEQAKVHPQKHVLTKAVGIVKNVEFDIKKLDIKSGYLVLCSDGLTNMVEDAEILNIVKNTDFSDVANRLICLANENGGSDNITVIVVNKGE